MSGVVAPGYEALSQLSSGRDLDVWEVWSEERACRCVAKVLRPDRRDAPRPRARLLAEGRLLERLTHPHLVRAYETIEDPEPTVILETLDGATLGWIVEHRRRRLPAVDLVHLGLQLASVVRYLHRNGIVHLDLKPANVISDGGHVKVIDLSLARAPGPVPAGYGTREYLSPEQARGNVAGPAADAWGLGATLFRAATGRRPFPDGDQLTRRAERALRLRRLPAELAKLIDECLEPDPAARPGIDDVLGRLDALLPAEPADTAF